MSRTCRATDPGRSTSLALLVLRSPGMVLLDAPLPAVLLGAARGERRSCSSSASRSSWSGTSRASRRASSSSGETSLMTGMHAGARAAARGGSSSWRSSATSTMNLFVRLASAPPGARGDRCGDRVIGTGDVRAPGPRRSSASRPSSPLIAGSSRARSGRGPRGSTARGRASGYRCSAVVRGLVLLVHHRRLRQRHDRASASSTTTPRSSAAPSSARPARGLRLPARRRRAAARALGPADRRGKRRRTGPRRPSRPPAQEDSMNPHAWPAARCSSRPARSAGSTPPTRSPRPTCSARGARSTGSFVVGTVLLPDPVQPGDVRHQRRLRLRVRPAQPAQGRGRGRAARPRGAPADDLWPAIVTNVPFVVSLVRRRVDRWSWLVLAISVFAVVAYSAPGLRFKERPFLDSLTSSTHFV